MPGSIPFVPQSVESKVLDFDRSEIAVGFMLDICLDDLKTLQEHFSVSLRNSVFLRTQNTMRVRQNDKYLKGLEEEIAMLESRWVLPLAKVNNIFESAVEFTDVPPKEVQPVDGNSGIEVTDVEKTDVQAKRRWLDEPAIVQLKSLGVKPYREALKQLRQLRHRRSQYKYLEVYFINLGRDVINLQSNLRLVLAMIDVVIKARQKFGDDKLASNPIGRIVREIISDNTLDDAVRDLGKLDLDKILGDSTQGGPAGNPTATPNTPTSDRNSATPTADVSSGKKPLTAGDVPPI